MATESRLVFISTIAATKGPPTPPGQIPAATLELKRWIALQPAAAVSCPAETPTPASSLSPDSSAHTPLTSSPDHIVPVPLGRLQQRGQKSASPAVEKPEELQEKKQNSFV